MEKLELPQAKDLNQIPKDETSKAIIIDLVLTTWKEMTQDPVKKATASDEPVLKIIYEAKGFKRNQAFGLPAFLTNASKYGRFIEKYNVKEDPEFQPTVGMVIKVFFDGEGKSNIIIAK